MLIQANSLFLDKQTEQQDAPLRHDMHIITDSSKTKMQEKGREVLYHEAQALCALADSLNSYFDEAVTIIGKTKGRLIVSGVGKSGHVGRKMAATFASTGQPAFFVHAAEAGHGDLGMITKDDTLLLISYSGEASELHALLDYAHRMQLPIVSITSKATSFLASHSTITLMLPDVPEACPMGLAPTTSTTLTMALGDALAVSLLTLKGFTKSDFNTFHPGGNLGHKLRSIQDFMHPIDKTPLTSIATSVAHCLTQMSQGGFGCVGIVDHDTLVGIITDGDVRRHMLSVLEANKVTDFKAATAIDMMTKNPIIITSDALMGDALAIFEKKSITNLFVVDTIENRKVVGILHVHDCLRGKVI